MNHQYETVTVHETTVHEDDYDEGFEWWPDIWSVLCWIGVVVVLLFLVTSCMSRPAAYAVSQPAVVQTAPMVHQAPVVVAPPVYHAPIVAPVVVPSFGFGYHAPMYRSGGMVTRRTTTITRSYSSGGFRGRR